MPSGPIPYIELFRTANPVGSRHRLEVHRKIPTSIIQFILPGNLKGGIHVSELHWNFPLCEQAFFDISVGTFIEVEIKHYDLKNNKISFTRKNLISRPSETEDWKFLELGKELTATVQDTQTNRLSLKLPNGLFGFVFLERIGVIKKGDKITVIPTSKNISQDLIECSSPEAIYKTKKMSDEVQSQFDLQKNTGVPLISNSRLHSYDAFKSSYYVNFVSEDELNTVKDLFSNTSHLFSRTLIGSQVYFIFVQDIAIEELQQNFLPNERIDRRQRLLRLAEQSYWYTQKDNKFRIFNEAISISGFIREDDLHIIRSVKNGDHAMALIERQDSIRFNQAYFLSRPVGFYYLLDSIPPEANNKVFIEEVRNKNAAFELLQRAETDAEEQLKEQGRDFVLFHHALDAMFDREIVKAKQASIELSNCKLTNDLQLERVLFKGNCKEPQIEVDDMVLVYVKGANERKIPVGKGIITEKTSSSITVSLPPFDAKGISKGCIIQKQPNTRMYSVQLNALDDFLDHNLLQNSLYNIFHNPDAIEPAEEIEVEFINRNINTPGNKQADAVRKALGNKNFVLIQGPPGTGKTTVITEIIKQLVKRGERLLVASQTHVAVDNVLEKIGNDKNLRCVRVGWGESISEAARPFLLDQTTQSFSEEILQLNDLKIQALAEYSANVGNLVGAIITDAEVRNNFDQFIAFINRLTQEERAFLTLIMEAWKKVAATTPKLFVDLFLHNQDVVFGTCIGIATNYAYSKNSLSFDTVILDEAGKANISETLTAISKAQKVILVGDHKQLPPFLNRDDIAYIRSLRPYEHLDEDSFYRALGVSLFEVLQKEGILPAQNKVMLNIQHRMHPDIADFISSTFYDSKVDNGPSTVHNHISLPQPFRDQVVFIDTAGDKGRFEMKERNSTSLYNGLEAKFIVENILPVLEESKVDFRQVAILTPYGGQKNKILELLHQATLPIEVATLDSFQGKEYDIIILSFTRSFTGNGKVGFLDDLRRLNVALSRARKKLILIGDSSTLMNDRAHNGAIFTRVFRKLINYTKNRGQLYRINQLNGNSTYTLRNKAKPGRITPSNVITATIDIVIERSSGLKALYLDLGNNNRGVCFITDGTTGFSKGQKISVIIKSTKDKLAECEYVK